MLLIGICLGLQLSRLRGISWQRASVSDERLGKSASVSIAKNSPSRRGSKRKKKIKQTVLSYHGNTGKLGGFAPHCTEEEEKVTIKAIKAIPINTNAARGTKSSSLQFSTAVNAVNASASSSENGTIFATAAAAAAVDIMPSSEGETEVWDSAQQQGGEQRSVSITGNTRSCTAGNSSSISSSSISSSIGSKSSSSMTTSAAEYSDEAVLASKPAEVPCHIAVIMDGNRRFGRETHKDPLQGHWAGGQTLVDFVQWCAQDGVEVVTVYAFSTENWHRDAMEVSTLMGIFAKYARSLQSDALARNIRVNVLSTDFGRLPASVQEAAQALVATTAHCTGFVLNVCLSYGGRGELVSACRSIAERLLDESDSSVRTAADISEETVAAHLCTKDYPDPEILIRTSGEFRLSNFLLWQLAYTEMFFLDKFWPQLTKADYRRILHQYATSRKRRFGT